LSMEAHSLLQADSQDPPQKPACAVRSWQVASLFVSVLLGIAVIILRVNHNSPRPSLRPTPKPTPQPTPSWNWHLGSGGQSCTDACVAAGLACSESSFQEHRGEISTKEGMMRIMRALGAPCDHTWQGFRGLDLGAVPYYTRKTSSWCVLPVSTDDEDMEFGCKGVPQVNFYRRLCSCI